MINKMQLKDYFDRYQDNNKICVSFKKDRNGELIRKETHISLRVGELFVKKVEYNDTKRTKVITKNREEITDNSLKTTHVYLATLFTKLSKPAPVKLKTWESFKLAKNKIKWIVEKFILNSWLIGGLVGKIIAYSANKSNPHYKTFSSQILADTLGPLIFPAGFKKPTLEKKGVIVLDPILHKQYKALEECCYSVKSQKDKKDFIDFQTYTVPVKLRNTSYNLETCRGSNKLVKPNENRHLHILYFNGNSGCFQSDLKLVGHTLLAYAEEGVPATAVQFNYPGVLNSQVQEGNE